MGLRTIVKVNRITNLADARYCAGMGVQMLGFCLDEQHSNFIDAKKAQEIASWVVGVNIVGEITASLPTTLSNYPLAMIEVDNAQLISELSESEQHENAPLIYKIKVDNVETLAHLGEVLNGQDGFVEYFLLESTLLRLTPQVIGLLTDLCASFPVLLGFGIDKSNVLNVLDTIKPAGIAFDAGKTTHAGVLEFEALIEILEILEVEE